MRWRGERGAPVADPALDDRGRHLGVELQADAAPGAERVRADRACARAPIGAGRQREGVVVPREPRARAEPRRRRAASSSSQPISGAGAARTSPPSAAGQRLAAEAQAEHRDPASWASRRNAICGAIHGSGEARDGVLGAERGDRAVVPRVGPRAGAELLRAQRHDAVAALAGPLLEQPGRRVGLLLDDAEVERHLASP